MDWMYIVALIVMIPIILLPVSLIWYLNLSSLIAALKKNKKEG